MSSYQSPICLNLCDVLKIEQKLYINGINNGATYNETKKIFEMNDCIILIIDSKIYQMIEYHFHIPSEHVINNENFSSEIHYVFVELNDSSQYMTFEHGCCPDVCNCCLENIDNNILVIGRTILDSEHHTILEKIQPKIPKHYFEYDGTLTTGFYSPVRWIVGGHPIEYNIEDISKYTKLSRPIQKLDGRLVLYNGNC